MKQKPVDLVTAMRRSAHAAPLPVPVARPGRHGKSNVTGYFPPEVKRQLRQIAADHGTTIQRLLAEGLNDLFVKYGKPEAAPLD